MQAFGPTTLTATTSNQLVDTTAGGPAPQEVSRAVFINESPFTVTVNVGDGQTGNKKIPAFTVDVVAVGAQFGGKILVSCAADITFSGTAPVSVLYVELYGKHEALPGTYPAALARLISVGNSVPLNATATAVANDGTTTPTEFVEASISGTKHISVLTDGSVKLMKPTGNANIDMLELAPSDDQGAGGFDVTMRLIWAQSDLIFFDKIGNGEMFRIRNVQGANSGIIVSGIGGRVRAWSVFSGTGSGTFNHGLGATPNVVCPTQNTVGSQTMGWDTANATSVHITAGNGAAWSAIALLMA